MALNEEPQDRSSGHISDHAELKAGYTSRGATPALPAYTEASTLLEHLDVHNLLHAEHNALGAETVLPQNPSAGHLAHHAALHKAENLRNASLTTAAFRAFTTSSPWNKPIGSAPVHPDSAAILAFAAGGSGVQDAGKFNIGGVGSSTSYFTGTAHYFATSDDPVYNVEWPPEEGYLLPAQFSAIRIPRGAKPSSYGPDYNDDEMTVWDEAAGYVAWFYNAAYDSGTDTWTARGGSVTYLDGNGVPYYMPNGSTLANYGGDPRNQNGTHRGLNGAVVAYRYDEYLRGAINHALRFSMWNTVTRSPSHSSGGWIYPTTGTDGASTNALALPHGARIRLRPGAVDISTFHAEAQPLLVALRDYGAILNDTSGHSEIKAQQFTHAPGEDQPWTMDANAILSIGLDKFDLIDYAYDWQAAPNDTLPSGPISLAPPGHVSGLNYSGDTISWDATSRATTYTLQRDGTNITGITGTNYTEASPSGSHTYRVRAHNSAGRGMFSESMNRPGDGIAGPPAFVAASSSTSTGSTQPVWTAPAGTTTDDTCYVWVTSQDRLATFTTPAGWTAAGVHQDDGNYAAALFYRVGGVSATDPVTFTTSDTVQNKGVIGVVYSGAGGLDGNAQSHETASIAAHVCPNVSNSFADTLPVSVLLERSSASFTSPAGWTERHEKPAVSASNGGTISERDTLTTGAGTITGATLTGATATSTAIMWTIGVKSA